MFRTKGPICALTMLAALYAAGPSWSASHSNTRKDKDDALVALVGSMQPVANVRFNPHDQLVMSWLRAMVPCPTQGYTMYDYLRMETDDARRHGLSETYAVIQTHNLVGVSIYMTAADGSPAPGSPKFLGFFYTFDFPWSDLQGHIPANLPAEDPIAHVVHNMKPVCQLLQDGQARNLVHSHLTY